MKISEYFTCFKCFRKATWQYAGDNYFACDNCLPRGECASCCFELKPGIKEQWNEDNSEIINSSGDYVAIRDENGQLVPCSDWNKL